MTKNLPRIFAEIYQRLYQYFGHRNWWPGETPFEVAIGAILTQNTAWKNVEKAIQNLKDGQLLSAEAIESVEVAQLAQIIRPSGYYNQKAKKLKLFVNHLTRNYQGQIERMSRKKTEKLRGELLKLYGIGEETADSILLYALNKAVFVVDAYTRRVLGRHGLVTEKASYGQIQSLLIQNIKPSRWLYNDYHAQVVSLGKEFCRKKPRCGPCPLFDPDLFLTASDFARLKKGLG